MVACSGDDSSPDDVPAAGTTPPVTREAPHDADVVAVSHILIKYEGVEGAPESFRRTKDEALEMAREVIEQARAGEDFAILAQAHSEGPSGPRGGNVGLVSREGGVPVEFFEAALALDYNEVSEPVDTRFGLHVIHRNDVEIASARHILVAYQGAMRAAESIERTREEALERCEAIRLEIEGGADFAQLAQEKSDGPTSVRGGDLGVFARGQMTPAFDEAVFALEPGQTSGVVETPFGCHVILRYR